MPPHYLSSLQQEAIRHAAAPDQRLPKGRQTGIRSDSIKTELQAGEYLSKVADAVLLQKGG